MAADVTSVPDRSGDRPTTDRPSITELVFAGGPSHRRRGLILSGAMVLGLYAGAFLLLGRFGRSAASWGAEMAAQIHGAIALDRAVDLTPPAPPPAPRAESVVAKAPPGPRTARAPIARNRPAAPTQAGQLAAANATPLDFTGSAFVVGTGSSFAGGKTTSTGTGRGPVSGAVAAGGTGNGAPAPRTRARPVSLDQAGWNCPWPAEADAQQVDEQTVVLRVAVRPDGRAERVEVVSDPGYGFGPAARQCALGTRFEPARDGAGQTIAALSPPIRVHFFR